MFSVPGWNVSTALQTQTDTPNSNTAQNGADEPASSKKRKRGHGKSKDGGVNSIGLGPVVTNLNVAEMWERHIEGKKVEKTVKSEERIGKKKRKSKESKVSINETESAEQDPKSNKPQASSPTPPANPSKPSKKKPKKDKKPNPPTATSAPAPAPPPSTDPTAKLTPLQLSMRAKLASARFRHLNETLYTTPSAASLALFRSNPEMFSEYHTGFAQQVSIWPENPVDSYIATVLTRGRIRARDPWKERRRQQRKGKPAATAITTDNNPTAAAAAAAAVAAAGNPPKPLPRALNDLTTLADLGCGAATLALALQPHLHALNLRIRSFDLAQPAGPAGPLVTVADVAALPLADASVDVAVFCLALMGTNWLDFVDEAWRVLRWRGELWVAEIKSRFGRVGQGGGGKGVVGHSVGSRRKGGAKAGGKKRGVVEGAEGSEDEEALAVEADGVEVDRARREMDVSGFVEVLRRRGFVLDGEEKSAVDLSNKMFVKMQFIKGVAPTRGKNAKAEEEARGGGMKHRKPRFVGNVEDEGDVGNEGSVLKPCVYKQR